MSKIKAYNHEHQERLARLYRHWEASYTDHLQWRKNKARNIDWWDRAAAICTEQKVSPELLLYVTFAFANFRPEDAEIPFSANSMRSESVMYRALANFRSAAQSSLRHLEDLYVLTYRQELVFPRSTTAVARMVAEMTCRYFETVLMVREYEARKAGTTLTVDLKDALAYKLCDRNPFLLLRVAKTPRVRAIAAVNAFLTADQLPWHFDVWEGIACVESLNDVERLAGTDPRPFYEGLKAHHAWPLTTLSHHPISGLEVGNMPLALHLLQFPLCRKTDLFLTTKRAAAKSGLPDPYET